METSTKMVDYHALNAMLNLPDPKTGKINFEADRQAVRQYFLEHVNKNTVFFHTLEEKIQYLTENGYWDKTLFNKYKKNFTQTLFDKAYAHKHRFRTFLGAYKFYNQYALKNNSNDRYLERYEDRVVLTALFLAGGDETLAEQIMEEIITGRYQPATPTFLNAGKTQRGELVSCFLLECEDNMESIGRMFNSCAQLSKRGGGVSINLTNLREQGAPIKNIQNISSGIVPVMKILDDIFIYANQLGARQGAGAVYVNVCHPDFMKALDTKRENADALIRIKALSIGAIIPNIAFIKAKNNEMLYQFSPYHVEKYYGKPLSSFNITEMYDTWVEDSRIHKTKIEARKIFQTIAELQFESGYPYLLFEDNANRNHPIRGRIKMSNLCSEILQASEPSIMNEDLTYHKIGQDISCNLGSLNIAKVMQHRNIHKTVETAVRALTSVSDQSKLDCVPSIREGNKKNHAIGLGQMNLHGYLASNQIHYDSPEALDFVRTYFYIIMYETIRASNKIAKEKGQRFHNFEESKYGTGEFFNQWIETEEDFTPQTPKVKQLFENIHIPSKADWEWLKKMVLQYGMYNAYRTAVAPTGSISYISDATSSIHPIVFPIETRKEGKIGRVYYPAYGLTNENLHYYRDAYKIGPEPLINIYAQATRFTDQGLSLTLFMTDENTTRDLNRVYIQAWKKGIKTLYYTRIRSGMVKGTETETIKDFCESCMI